MMRMMLIAAGLPLLAACQPMDTAPGDAADGCGAAKVQSWVGKKDSPAARAAIAKESGAGSIRWLTPGMPVTMDYRLDRLNAKMDASGTYTGLDCG